ncbi:MAG TPA: 23S rRNA (pseudouridine(1915)-N(3))-methyltransferase RlmH [Candidatus Saccharimonadales bacterium]|nr:23S rRNA (pseudouridine(1915)-N(3))-methyltransferase RlmH [Candidatus Saccharimonadales bacterium]
MPIQIIAIGKKHEAWVADGIEKYEARLRKPFMASWLLLPHSSRQKDEARREESARILEALKGDDFVILLDERGKLLDSVAFSRLLLAPLESSRRIVCIIGGAYGVDASVHARADSVWSLSPLVFPHQLVRLLLVEQLYRAQEISHGGLYHHE